MFNYTQQLVEVMSFQNKFRSDGSININVTPSFGHIINASDVEKQRKVKQVEAWRVRKGSMHAPPKDFNPSRYASLSVREIVEEPVSAEHILQYVEKSRLSRRLGF